MPPLRALAGAGHDIALVVTRPDRRRGRGGATSPSPVKAAARELGLLVDHDVRAVVGAGAELGVVVAYGRLIPADVLAAVPMVNLHFSLLPRWRGAAPLERAILAGDPVTGVCVMAVEETLDTGPVYARREVPLGDEPLDVLQHRLSGIGAELVVDLLARGKEGIPAPEAQVGEPTYAAKVEPDEHRLHWEQPARQLARVVRLGHAFSGFRGRRLRILEAEARPDGDRPAPAASAVAPGTLIEGGAVATGEGVLALRRVQPEGRAAMAVGDWLRGARPRPGERLG